MLRLVVGFKSHAREQDPVVLYLGHSGEKAHAVIAENIGKVGAQDCDFVGLGITEVPVLRKARISPATRDMLARTSVAAGSVMSSEVETSPQDGLDTFTVDELETYAREQEISLNGCNVKAEHLRRIRDFETLNEKTVPELRELADSEGSIEGISSLRKAELINAILESRRCK